MAFVFDLIVEQGASYKDSFTLKDGEGDPYNLTGYTIEAKLSKSYKTTTKTSFTVNVTNTSEGKIDIILSSSQTSALKAGLYVYDIVITHTGNSNKTRVVEGQIEVTAGVTL